MLPDLESLRCFVAAAEQLNFRAAARQVGLSPAALGQRVRALETLLGVSLFIRTTRRVTLTEQGIALLPSAHRALESAANCLRAARGDLGPVPIELTLGTRHELGLSWLVPMLPLLREAHPGLTSHVYFGSGSDLEDRLRSRQIDCAITSRQCNDPLLESVRIHQETYVFVGAPCLLKHQPLATPEDSASHTVVDTNPTKPLLSYLKESTGPASQWNFKSALYMGTIDAIRQVVIRGDGVAVLPEYLLPDDLATKRLVPLCAEFDLHSDWFRLLFRADDPLRSLYLSLAEIMRSQPLR